MIMMMMPLSCRNASWAEPQMEVSPSVCVFVGVIFRCRVPAIPRQDLESERKEVPQNQLQQSLDSFDK